MAKKNKTKKTTAKKQKITISNNPLKYKQMTVELAFTDGEIETVTFYSPADCFRYIERTVTEHYANSVRVELF